MERMGLVLCLLMGESTQRCDVPLTPWARVQAGATLAAAAGPFLTLEISSTISVPAYIGFLSLHH